MFALMSEALARRSKKAMVAECMRSNVMHKYVIINISRIVKSEIRALHSILRNQSVTNLS